MIHTYRFSNLAVLIYWDEGQKIATFLFCLDGNSEDDLPCEWTKAFKALIEPIAPAVTCTPVSTTKRLQTA